MAYSIELLEVTYNRSISPPCFDIALSVPQLLTALYERLSPEVLLKLSDMQALAGTSMSDVGVKVKLFNGNFDLQITPERLIATASAIRESQDLKVVRRCVEIAQECLEKKFPSVKFGEGTLTAHGWLRAGTSNDPTAEKVIASARPSAAFIVEQGETIIHPARLRIRNAAQRYSCELTCDETRVPNSQLYFNVILNVENGSAYSTLDEIAALSERLLRRWFCYLGVPFEEES